MDQKVSITQLSREQWQPGEYVEAAMIPLSSNDCSQMFGINFEEFWEDGLGRAKAAGLITSNGKQFSVIEYLDAPSHPTTYILMLNNSATMSNHLRDIVEAFGLSLSDLLWLRPDVKAGTVE